MGVYVYLARSTVDGIRIGVSILLVMGGNGGRGNGVTRMIHQKKVLTLWGKLDKRTFQPRDQNKSDSNKSTYKSKSSQASGA